MIDSTTSVTPGRGSASGSSGAIMGTNDFMTLLLTQLRHQDPMNPLEPHEFASQLANFTSVEQLGQIRDGMLYQLESLQVAAALNKTTFSAALVGRSILAEGNRVHVPDGGKASIHVEVGAGGGEAVLKLYDESGSEIASREMGTIEAGRQVLELPDDLPEGTYTYRLTVEGAGGESVSVKSFVSGIVDRVIFEEGRIVLRVNGLDVDMDSLIEIAAAGSEA